MMSFYNQNEYENCQPGSYYWLEEETLATARARQANEEENPYSYPYYDSAQVAYPAVQRCQYNYGPEGQIHQFRNLSEQEKWEFLAVQISYLYYQRKYGLGGQRQYGQERYYPPNPQTNYSYDDHQDYGWSENLVGQDIQKKYCENNEEGHQFQGEIHHAHQVDYYDHQEHGWSPEMIGQSNEEKEDSEKSLSVPRRQAAQAITGSEDLKTMILLLQDVSAKLGSMEKINVGSRTVMETNQSPCKMDAAPEKDSTKALGGQCPTVLNPEEHSSIEKPPPKELPLEEQPLGKQSLAEDNTKTLEGQPLEDMSPEEQPPADSSPKELFFWGRVPW